MNIFSRCRLTLAIALSTPFLGSCGGAQQAIIENKNYPPYINTDQIVGLTSLDRSKKEAILDYELDSNTGKTIKLKSCPDVEKLNKADVVPSQFHLFTLLKVNCAVVNYYFKSLKATTKYQPFPSEFSEDFLINLPATALPSLGGESLSSKKETLNQQEPKLEILNLQNTEAELALSGDMVVNYHLMARGDFDLDGYEDMLLRLDWHITTAFGKGFDLVMLSKALEDSTPKITWRYQ